MTPARAGADREARSVSPLFAGAAIRVTARAARALRRRWWTAPPMTLLHRIRHDWREALSRPRPLAATEGEPFLSVLIPVHDRFDFLARAIDSALGQSGHDLECVIVNDASTDPRVAPLLESYRPDPRVRVISGATRLGISGATNRAIAAARGRWLAFLDCDDELAPRALERVRAHLARHPEADFVYTNRVDIDAEGREVERWDFTPRSFGDPREELLIGMYASHLKVIRRDAFRHVGLFRSEFDGAQDYDLALRLSEWGRLSFLRETLYRHRIHPRQTTRRAPGRQSETAARARDRALLRREIAAGRYRGLVSIVVRRGNRREEPKACLDAIARHTPFEHEIIAMGGAAPPDAGAPTGPDAPPDAGAPPHAGGRTPRGEYVVVLDDELAVREGWLARLLTEMEWNARLAACSCRVLLPDGTTRSNGGRAIDGDRRIRFELRDAGLHGDDLATLVEHPCEWLPAGATIFRSAALEACPRDPRFPGVYGDYDWSLRARRAGWELAACPLATATEETGESAADVPLSDERLIETLLRFHRAHGVFIDDEALYRRLGFAGGDAFIESALAAGSTEG